VVATVVGSPINCSANANITAVPIMIAPMIDQLTSLGIAFSSA
jgi:hypothetical protein